MPPFFARAVRVLPLACALALVGAPAAFAAGGISGHLADGGAPPTGGMCVYAQSTNPMSPTFGQGNVAADGSYDIAGLTAGSYWVNVNGCPQWNPDTHEMIAPGDYVAQWYDGATSQQDATRVTVTDSGVKSGIDFALEKAAHITGTVTDAGADDGHLTGGACVSASKANGQMVGWAEVASDGSYDMSGLPHGTYSVQFFGCPTNTTFPPGPAGDYIRQTRSDQVTVTAGHTAADIDAALVKAGHIKGSVTDTGAEDGHLTGGVCVSASKADGPAGGSATVASNGSYDIGGLETGSYQVRFYGCQGFDPMTGPTPAGDYAPQTRSSVDVTAGSDTSHIDATLGKPGHITGTVTNGATHQHVGGGAVCVSVSNADSTVNGFDMTDASGTYDISVPAGSYQVTFTDCGSGAFDAQYYDSKNDWSKANLVTVAAGATHPGIDATMTKDTAPTDGGDDGTGGGDTTGDAPTGDAPADTTPAPAPRSQPTPPAASPLATPAAKPVVQCVVPNLKGKSLAKAKKLLAKANCKVGKVSKAKDKKVKKGLVSTQAKKAGKALPAGAKINFVLSRGRR